MCNRQHAGQLRLVDSQMWRLRTIHAQILRIMTFVEIGWLWNDFDRDTAGRIKLRLVQCWIVDKSTIAEGSKIGKKNSFVYDLLHNFK